MLNQISHKLRIAVDLTPLRPGGENGGGKILVLELLTQFKELFPAYDFLLLTSDWNHQELSAFDGPRFKRICVLHDKPQATPPDLLRNTDFLTRSLDRLRQIMPEKAVSLLLPAARQLKQKWVQSLRKPYYPKLSNGLLRNMDVSLLFCPFTAPSYAEVDIPVVSIVYDLQHRTYPQFFSPHESADRDATLDQVRLWAKSIICISEYSRQTLLTHYNINPCRTFTVHVCIHSRLKRICPSSLDLNKWHLLDRPYLFYPANFWPHKNHRMLLTAYNILLKRNKDLELDLVFTGTIDKQEKELQAATEAMGLNERVHFLGYLSDEELAVVLQGCRFMIFPSLYEGFGIPLLEAFSFGKPVLCSRIGSLPEIGGDAAWYFDPRKPLSIVEGVEKFLTTPDLTTKLIKLGYEQVAKFREENMANAYLEIFNMTLSRASFRKRN